MSRRTENAIDQLIMGCDYQLIMSMPNRRRKVISIREGPTALIVTYRSSFCMQFIEYYEF